MKFANRAITAFIIALDLAIAATAAGQTQVRTHWGNATGLGNDVVAPGDLNGDGVCDYVANDPATSLHKTDIVIAWSGKTGSVLYSLSFPTANSGFGGVLGATGDVTGDGVPDIMLGSPHGSVSPAPGIPATPVSGAIYIFSGANGAFVRTNTQSPGSDFGGYLHQLPDLTGDGLAEYAAYGLKPNGKNALIVFNGANDSSMYSLEGAPPFGNQVRSVADENGDGVPEIAVGDQHASTGSLFACGAVRVVSGANGAELRRVFGKTNNEHVGAIFDTIQDVTGDGLSDYASISQDPFLTNRIRVVSGSTGDDIAPMAATPQPPISGFGGPTAVCDDWDGDGWPEYLAKDLGYPGWSINSTYMFSSRTATLLYRRDNSIPPFSSTDYPKNLFVVGDVTGDGKKDWLIGDPDLKKPGSISGIGAVEIITSQSLWSQLKTIGANASPDLLRLEINAGLAAANAPFFMLMSFTGSSGLTAYGVPMPLAYDPLTQLGITFANTPIFTNYFGALDPDGHAVSTFDASVLPPQADGLTFRYSALVIPAGKPAFATIAVETAVDVQ